MKFEIKNITIGSDDRIIAEKRPSAASRANLAAHLEPLANDRRTGSQYLAEIAAGRALDRDGGHEQREVVLADAVIEIAHRGFQIGAVGHLVGDDAELGPPTGSGISRATMAIATGTGCPARRLRTMTSMASGNCSPNFFCRRPRRKYSEPAAE
jgi:hypothetical protein